MKSIYTDYTYSTSQANRHRRPLPSRETLLKLKNAHDDFGNPISWKALARRYGHCMKTLQKIAAGVDSTSTT